MHMHVDVAVGGELRDPQARVHGPDGAAEELRAAQPARERRPGVASYDLVSAHEEVSVDHHAAR